MKENNNDYITYSLEVLKYAFKNSDPAEISSTAQQHCDDISNFLVAALEHHQARIISDTLRVAGLFIIQLKDLEGNLGPEFEGAAKLLFKGINEKFQKKDID